MKNVIKSILKIYYKLGIIKQIFTKIEIINVKNIFFSTTVKNT